jgi:cyclophilin family peptidyl-prolyl cis-trans isomerase
MMPWAGWLLAGALLQAQTPAVDPAFRLTPGRAGSFEVGATIDRVYEIIPREKTRLVDEFLEGHFSPALVIKVDGSPVERPLVARIREAPCTTFTIDGISVYDPRYRTPEGIGVGSSLADVRRVYPVSRGYGEEGPVAVAERLSMTFVLSDETERATVRLVWIHLPPADVRRRCRSASGQPGPSKYRVVLDTSKGPIVIAVHRRWAPRGADRFYELVTSGYYDDARFFRIRKGTWVQFGIAGDPKVAQAWRTKPILDDPWVGVPNTRGTVAFAFRDPDARTTQVFINLKDNSETHDKEPFVVFGTVEQGIEVADALYAEYGEAAGGGIRAGRQDPVFEGGNAYLTANFPLLDYIRKATIIR